MFSRKGILVSFSTLLSIGLVCVTLAPAAHADTWNQRTIVTFGAPVEVPGRVLPAGTYTFQLLNNLGGVPVVRIFNKNRTKVYDTFIAIYTYRTRPTGKSVIDLQERPSGSPMAVHKWFYPGMHFGQEFVYPRIAPSAEMANAGTHSTSAQG